MPDSREWTWACGTGSRGSRRKPMQVVGIVGSQALRLQRMYKNALPLLYLPERGLGRAQDKVQEIGGVEGFPLKF